MNRKKQLYIIKTATLKNTLVLGVIFLIMAFFIMPEAEQEIKFYANGIGRIDGIFYYFPDQIYDRICAYGDKGRALYIIVEFTADFFFWIVIALFLCSLMVWSTFNSKSQIVGFNYLVWLPSLLLLTNCIENTGIMLMLLSYPEKCLFLSLITSLFAFSKTLLILACFYIVVRSTIFYLNAKYNFGLTAKCEDSMTK